MQFPTDSDGRFDDGWRTEDDFTPTRLSIAHDDDEQDDDDQRSEEASTLGFNGWPEKFEADGITFRFVQLHYTDDEDHEVTHADYISADDEPFTVWND